jgi:protein-S-isoprenylcysteine O-methyltransferase Ste14
VIAGWALTFRSQTLAVYMLVVAAVFHGFVTLYEEPHLTRMFGSAYREYCATVRRWAPYPK